MNGGILANLPFTKVRHASEGHDVDVDLPNYREDGSSFWNAPGLSPVGDKEGTIRISFKSQLDVAERIEAHNIINQQKELVEMEVERCIAESRAALEGYLMRSII